MPTKEEQQKREKDNRFVDDDLEFIEITEEKKVSDSSSKGKA